MSQPCLSPTRDPQLTFSLTVHVHYRDCFLPYYEDWLQMIVWKRIEIWSEYRLSNNVADLCRFDKKIYPCVSAAIILLPMCEHLCLCFAWIFNAFITALLTGHPGDQRCGTPSHVIVSTHSDIEKNCLTVLCLNIIFMQNFRNLFRLLLQQGLSDFILVVSSDRLSIFKCFNIMLKFGRSQKFRCVLSIISKHVLIWRVAYTPKLPQLVVEQFSNQFLGWSYFSRWKNRPEVYD